MFIFCNNGATNVFLFFLNNSLIQNSSARAHTHTHTDTHARTHAHTHTRIHTLSPFLSPTSCLPALLQSVKELARHANNLVNGAQCLRQAVRRGYLLTSPHLVLVPILPWAA